MKKIDLSEMYVIEPKDVPTLKAVFDYAFHRTIKHGKTIASFKEIQRIRKELGIINEQKFNRQADYVKTL